MKTGKSNTIMVNVGPWPWNYHSVTTVSCKLVRAYITADKHTVYIPNKPSKCGEIQNLTSL